MNLKDLQAKLEAEIAEAKLKVETKYVELVEAGKTASSTLEREYVDAIDELNEKLAVARKYSKLAESFLRRNGKNIIIGGLIVLAILSVGYLSGFFAV